MALSIPEARPCMVAIPPVLALFATRVPSSVWHLDTKARRFTSARPLPKKNYLDRLDEDHEVEHQGMVLDVVQIVFELFDRILF